MNVLHVSFGGGIYDQIHLALLEQGINSRVLTLYKSAYELEQAKTFEPSAREKKMWHYHEAIENFARENLYKIKKDIDFSIGYTGYNISHHEWVEEADIIHLNWTTRNWLSVNNIGQLLRLNKPVVWTLHDVWGLTGGCHVLLNGCDKWETSCGNCPFIREGKWHKDISYFIMKQKEFVFNNSNLTIVAPSTWMKNNVQKSRLFRNSKIYHIPNMLRTEDAKPYSKAHVESALLYHKEDEISILFGTAGSVQRKYKGFQYIKEALYFIKEHFPEIANKWVIHMFGQGNIEKIVFPGYKVVDWGIPNGADIFYLYNLADIYLYPSMADNLPGTVMESLICETPVVCFDTGGISDMVKHKQNGYMAQKGDISDFVNGILWVLKNNENNILGKSGSKYIVENFSKKKVITAHMHMYEEIMSR